MHLTVRMAWHDNNWNGAVCRNPEGNTYCTGAHSLLSGRIEKRKETALEQTHKGQEVAKAFTGDYVPPCYWSINAFGQNNFDVEQGHAFEGVAHTIPAAVKPYSVFTWPFKLSFNHTSEKQKSHGNYPPNLDQRINRFIGKFTPGESIIFFYANYDNPVSADEMKYLLLGCSVISDVPSPQYFPFAEQELQKFRSSKKMKNFPTINWALQFSHDPEKSILLPYREYVNYVEENPADEEKLDDMKVIIEEESLIRGFKYVAMDIDDDKCLYLLYKIRKSIKKIQDHEQLVVASELEEEEQRINELIEMTWQKRGIYPSLDKVLAPFFNDDVTLSQKLARAIVETTDRKRDMLQIFREIADEDIPEELEDYKDDLYDLADSRLFRKKFEGLSKLSLFNLTQHQMNKIIDDSALLETVATNPYVLYEEYVADEDDLDEEDMQDERLDVYKIDIGMIPDRKFVKRHRGLQNLSEDSPERIRSVMINYLWRIGDYGHCYDHTDNILEEIKEHPLIYKNDITLDEEALINLDDDYKSHFLEKLFFKEIEGQRYFYLKPIKEAEVQLNKVIDALLKRPDHSVKPFDYDSYILKSLDQLSKVIIHQEDESRFIDERERLYQNIFTKSFYLLTGRPGAGKTHEVSKVIEQLQKLHEEILILTPTGKAALRLSEFLKQNTDTADLSAKTIDKFIYENRFSWAYDDWDRLERLPDKEKLTVENLIIDESSMIDLIKLKILMSIIRFNDAYPKRIILVGDENQLPPIGFGKPFHDIISHIISSQELMNKHYINLKSNCRQENDIKILQLAEAFTDKKRYYEEALDLLEKEGQVSEGLFICKWKSNEELNEKINTCLGDLFDQELEDDQTADLESDEQKLNVLFGLYMNGYVNNQGYQFRENLKLDEMQLLSPYRAGYYGTVGINQFIQDGYRTKKQYSSANSNFYHSDKIIRLQNWYSGWGAKRKLVLSNGSIGIITGEKKKRKYYFRDLERPQFYIDDEENFDLAYAITVHKSQGSDFRNVFLVVPQKRSLLCRELIYTALTRSKFRLFLFIQETEDDILKLARNVSHLTHRNTSVFSDPMDNKKKLYPDPNNKPVKSRIEYIIYRTLQKSGLEFEYETLLELEKRSYDIHPDFTIKLKSGTTIYWEHLGMLDVRKYYKDWQKRKKDYLEHGLFDYLVTTDDLNGINQQKVDTLIQDIREDSLKESNRSKFSNYHYELY